MSKKKDLRALNERIFHLIDRDEFEAALDLIQSKRRSDEELLYSNDLLTWFMSISERVHLDVRCSENDKAITTHPHSQLVSEKFVSEKFVRFVSIEGLETSLSPSSASEIDILSEISSSMKVETEGPIFPTASSSCNSIIAIAPVSKCSHSTTFNRNVVFPSSQLSLPVVWIVDVQTMDLLYTIENNDLSNQLESFLGISFVPRRDLHQRVSALKFSRSGKYLLIAQSYSNSSSLVFIWCTLTRSCVGRLLLKDKEVLEVKWNNSDTLISIFYSEDKFLNYFLDWPIVEVLNQPPQLSSWLCGKSHFTLSLSLLDTLVLSENLEPPVNRIDNTKLIHGGELWSTNQYFDHLYETEYTWLWTQEKLHSYRIHSELLNCFVQMKKWVVDEVKVWLHTDIMNYCSRVQQLKAPFLSQSSVDKSQTSKVCLIVGDPYLGKSYLMTNIASQLAGQSYARICIPREMVMNSTPNSVAFHMIVILSHQLRDTFAESYVDIVLRELSNQLKSMKKSHTKGLIPNSHKSRSHHRHFSTASSSLGSIDLNHPDDEIQDYESLLWFTSHTLKWSLGSGRSEDSTTSTCKVPSITALSVHALFKCFIEVPLREIPPPPRNFAIFVDGLDVCNCSTTLNHYQAVLTQLTHNTPTWCKIVLTSRMTANFIPYLADINTTTINLNEDRHLVEDFYLLTNHLLTLKGFQGDVKKGTELLFSSLDLSMKNFIQLYALIPFECDLETLQRLLHSYDPIHFTLQEQFFSPASEVSIPLSLLFHVAQKFTRSKRILAVVSASFEPPSITDIANSLGDLKEEQASESFSFPTIIFSVGSPSCRE